MKLDKLILGGVIAAVFGLATSRAEAYRTAAELPSISSATPVRWPGGSYNYVVVNLAPAGLPFEDYQRTVDAAVAVWTQADCSAVGVRDVGPMNSPARPGDGLNSIEWIPRGWADRGYDPTVPGQTDVLYERDPSGSWIIKEADIYLNGEFNGWDFVGESQSSAWSVRSVLIHEGGHAVGLLHPCDIAVGGTVPACSSVAAFDGVAMNPIYSPSLTALSSDDVAGICSIYAKGFCVDRACAETETCTGTGCRLICGNTTCDDGQLCSAGGCVYPASVPIPVEGASKDTPCSSIAECQRGLSCIAGTCQGGPRRLGDLCERDTECHDGVCTAAGYCAAACQTAGTCSELNANCLEMLGGVGACIGVALPLGSPCDSADDCVGQECLVDGEQAPVCTRACAADSGLCPSGWQCVEVEGKDVCVTPTVDGGGCGCRLNNNSRQSPSAWVLSILTLTTMILRRGQGGSRRAV